MNNNIQFKELQQRMIGKSLDELYEEITVDDEFDNEQTLSLDGWFAVTTDQGIIAYFENEGDAFGFRLDIINRILNY